MSVPDDVRDCLAAERERYDGTCLQLAPHQSLIDWQDADTTCIALDTDFDPSHGLGTIRSPVQLAIVVDAPNVLSRIATRQLLGRLRNYTAGAVIAAFAAEPAKSEGRWSSDEFLGLGFRRLAQARELASAYWLYRYDIYDYKTTPDWLNSRHWAHPERWGKARW